MDQKTFEETKAKILAMPLSELDAFFQEHYAKDGGQGLQEVISQIESDAEYMLRKTAYLEHRVWGGNHAGAVQDQNKELKKIRAAMTKMITHDVHF